MLKNLKKSEKILLSILLGAVIFSLIVVMIIPKFTERANLESQKESLEESIKKLNTEKLIETSPDPSVDKEASEIDNKLLSYKSRYFIDDFSQELLILKLNEFIPADSNNDTNFQTEIVTFTSVTNVPRYKIDDGSFFEYVIPDVDPNQDPNASPAITPAPTATPTPIENADGSPVVPDTASQGTNQTPAPTATPIDATTATNTTNTSTLLGLSDTTSHTFVSNFLSANIQFTSSYENLITYIKNLEKYTDSYVISSIDIQPVVESTPEKSPDSESTSGYRWIGDDGYITDVPDSFFMKNAIVKGNMQIVFIEFPIYYDDIEYTTTTVLDKLKNTKTPTISNPFAPFDNFVHYTKPAEKPIDIYDDTTYVPSRIYKTVYDFEKSDYFFASSPKSTTGYVSSSPLSYSGNRSGKLGYNFAKGVETSTASLVFDSTSVAVTGSPDTIGLYAYNFSDFVYDIGITVKDSSGVSYDLQLNPVGSYGSLWKYYEANLPTMNSPFIITRVFVTTNGQEKTQLQGELLIDKIQIGMRND